MSRKREVKRERAAEPCERYFNRELSWLQFNKRVLEEAANPANPLLERLKFLSIFESNLDEFYMVRVSGLIEQRASDMNERSPDGLLPSEQLYLLAESAKRLRSSASALWRNDLEPKLKEEGIEVVPYRDLSPRIQSRLQTYFRKEIFPICTPLMLWPAPSMPFISNRSLNLLVELRDGENLTRLGRVKIPTTTNRAIAVSRSRTKFVLLEDIIESNLGLLFPGVEIVGSHRFRVIRDADVEIMELEADDLIESIEKTIRMRRFGDAVLLEVASTMPRSVRERLRELLGLENSEVFSVEGPIGFEVLNELLEIPKPSLRYPPMPAYLDDRLRDGAGVFQTVAERDVLVHHPYDSFRSVQDFVAAAAADPDVIGIKQTLYRVGPESPIVESLLAAANAGKQVTAMVELKARFDESNNLVWARALEHSGAHVTYGFPQLKTHCKLCLIVRREAGQLKMYAHIGTGNYNPTTARQYTDFGLFTCDPDITQDVSELFNYLTGFSKQSAYRKLMVAPVGMRQGLEALIAREVGLHRKRKSGGRMVFKVNSLTDIPFIDALQAAAKAGVKVDLIVRGVCCLRAYDEAIHQNTRIVSVVGRFLEHSRAYYFDNGGTPEVWIGSADIMHRNLDRRVEVLVPIRESNMVRHLRDDVLEKYFQDNTNAWFLQPDGPYKRRTPPPGKAYTVQEALAKTPLSRLTLDG